MRVAGTGLLPDGRRLTWTLAEGVRGRRWRSATTGRDGRLVEALLLEVSPDGQPTKLEVATDAGLLTLHPEPDGRSLNGNAATPHGMHHHALAWSDACILVVAGSPLPAAVAAAGLAARVGVGEGRSVPAVEVGPGLAVRAATWRVARTGELRWRLLPADGGPGVLVSLTPDGVPDSLETGVTWPLEVDPE